MMVDLGEGTRERFKSLDEYGGTLPPLSSPGYSSHTPTEQISSYWQSKIVGQGALNRLRLLDAAPNSLIQIKSDPGNLDLGNLCSNTSTSVPLPGPPLSLAGKADDPQMRGQLFQDLTGVPETLEHYTSPQTPPDRNLAALSEAHHSHSDYINIQSWNHDHIQDKNPRGHISGSLFSGTALPSETVINPLQYNASPHLVPNTLPSSPPHVSTTVSPVSVPVCSPVERVQPLSLALRSSASPHMACPLPITIASAHTSINSSLSSAHHPSGLQPSLATIDEPSQSQGLTTHETLDDALNLASADEDGLERVSAEYRCQKCGVIFSRLLQLKHHMKVHTEVEESVKGLPQKSLKCRSESSEKLFQSDAKFSTAEKLKIDEVKHSKERIFQCNECGVSFQARAMLLRHKKVHTREKPYKCDVCKACFTETGSLKVHKRQHSGEKPFKCDQCDAAFHGASMLATHRRKHTGEKPYICDDCGETFRLLSTLKSHRRRHTGEKPFVCDQCGSSFTQRAPLQRHKMIHSDKKPWECDHCGHKFRDKESLRKHLTLHTIKKQHLCDICGAGFNQAKRLETHKMLHNGGDRPYQCNKCPSAFTNPKYLTQHKRRVHARKGAIKCEECNGTFKRKETLLSHMKIHAGECPYVCEECGAAFNQSGTLTKHSRVHGTQIMANDQSKDSKTKSQLHDRKNEEDKSFKCSVCNIKLSCEKELVQHTRSSHSSLGSLQKHLGLEQDVDDSIEHIRDKYICEDCDQTFFRRRQLKAHKKYCPCRVQAYEADTPKKENTPSTKNEIKGADAMKILTAVLAVTGNNPNENSHFQQPSSPLEHSSSVSSLTSCSTSAVTSNVLGHDSYQGSPHLMPDNISHHIDDSHSQLKVSHLERSPHQPLPLQLSLQHQHNLLHEVPDDTYSLRSSVSLEHLPQHQKNSILPTHTLPSDHDSSRFLITQDFEHLQLLYRSGSHLQQQPVDQEADGELDTHDNLEEPLRPHSSLQQGLALEEHMHSIQRHFSPLHEPPKEHCHISQTYKFQDLLLQSSKLRTFASREPELHLSHNGMLDHLHHFQIKQNHAGIEHHHHQMEHVEQVYRSTSQFTHPSQDVHNHHHHPHLPHASERDDNVHLPGDFDHTLQDIDDCDNFANNLHQQQCQEEADSCPCPLESPHQQTQHLPQHYGQHTHLEESIAHHHQHHQHTFYSELRHPNDIKVETY